MISWRKAAWMVRYPLSAYRELKMVRFVAEHMPVFGERPWFDEEDLEVIAGLLDRERVVVEYGTGSSTLYFGVNAKAVHSVDSSRNYIAAVAAEAARRDLSNVHLSLADIGPVGDWGWPIDVYPTAKNLQKWKAYLEAPWSSVGDVPVGLVVVDGRFRAACTAYSIGKLLDRHQSNFVIFLDDFVGREESYGRLSEIAVLERTPGRGVFVIPRETEGTRARDLAKRWVTDCR